MLRRLVTGMQKLRRLLVLRLSLRLVQEQQQQQQNSREVRWLQILSLLLNCLMQQQTRVRLSAGTWHCCRSLKASCCRLQVWQQRAGSSGVWCGEV
jgi:hypothetical protein